MKKMKVEKSLLRKKGIGKKVTAVLLTAVVMMTEVSMTAEAADKPTSKQEVVYVNLNSDGTLSETYVVNIFDLSAKGQILDYGNYTETRNMTSTENITVENDSIQIQGKKGKTYYEGKIEGKEIPWIFEFHYYLDDVEYRAEEMAGKSGAWKVTMSIKENPQGDKSFFENYALQISFTLDTNRTENIVAEGATMANVGADKQLTYTIMPGQEKDITVTADVTEFEMSQISVNGIRLNMDVNVDDEELMEQITELQEGIEKLNNGAGEMEDGVSDLRKGAEEELADGVKKLDDGAGQLGNGASILQNGGVELKKGARGLNNGAKTLDTGLQSLNSGINQVQEGLILLNSQSGELTDGSAEVKAALLQIEKALSGVSTSTEELTKLTEASTGIKTGIGQLNTGISQLEQNVSFAACKAVMSQKGLDVEQLLAANTTTMQQLNSQISMLETVSGNDAQISQLRQMQELLGANSKAIEGMGVYLDTVNQSVVEISKGAKTLAKSYEEFDGNIVLLTEKMTGLMYQMSQLSQAVSQLVTEYEKLDVGINQYTEGVAEILAGYGQLTEGSTALLEGSGSLAEGSQTLYKGTSELLEGITEFYEATGSLKDGTGKLDEGVAKLLTGIITLQDGTKELQDGTKELYDETSDMDTKVSDQIDELLETISGKDGETVSFVSPKNTEVESVQFVIRTNSIEIPDEESVEEDTKEAKTFWEKLKQLF